MCETKRYRGRKGEGMFVRLRDTEEERERECV